jgi:hypothetical protein
MIVRASLASKDLDAVAYLSKEEAGFVELEVEPPGGSTFLAPALRCRL